MPDSTTISRADYLKRYMTSAADDSSKKKKKKRTKETGGDGKAVKSNGMRLLDEDDTFGQCRSKQKRRNARVGSSDEEDDDDEDEEEEEEEEGEMNDVDRAIRALNRRERRQRKRNKGDGGGEQQAAFKTDTFVSLTEAGPGKEVSKQRQQTKLQVQMQAEKRNMTTKESSSSEDSSGDNAPAVDNIQTTELAKVSAVPPVKKTKQKESSSEDSSDENNGPTKNNIQATKVTTEATKVKAFPVKKTEPVGSYSEDSSDEKETVMRDELRRDDQQSGKGAETRRRVTGFKRGKRGTAEDEAKKGREAEKQMELEVKYKEWNRGVAQLKGRQEKLDEMERTLGEGFARYADDEAMNKHLMEKLHEEDPMADYFRTKLNRVRMRNEFVYPTFKGQWLPNRYSIPPGFRWDGVDRSNGFESKVSLEKNKRKAHDELAYRSIAECE